MIKLTLPYPISANRYWRTYMPKGHKTPVTVVSPEAKKFKEKVMRIAHDAGITAPMSGRIEIAYQLYPRRPKDWQKRQQKNPENWDDTVQCIDLDNAQKVTFDSMKGIVFTDDDMIFCLSGKRAEPDEFGPRVEVTIRRM